MGDSFDLVVIGAGPAGEKAAAQAAFFGKRVAVVEREPEPGGAAVHTGTLPSKTLRETALYYSGRRARELYGVAVELTADATLQGLMDRKAAIAAAESARVRANLERHGVEYVRGHGRFVGPHRVAVDTEAGPRVLRGEFVLLCTGSKPRRPADIDFASPRIFDSDTILHLDTIPESLVVLGGGVIGSEYACMFAALGVAVTLVDTRERVLPFLDSELVDGLTAAMQGLGMRLRLGTGWGPVRDLGPAVEVELPGGAVRASHVLFAAGRVGRSDGLGLEAVGLEANSRGNLPVDEAYATAVPHVLAAGDLVGFPALASTSMEQGRVAVCRAFGFEYKREVSGVLPYGIYTIPELSAVGESEESAREKGLDFVVGRARYRDNARGRIAGDVEGLTKLVVERGSRRILGVHVLGERATELVHVGQAAMLAGAGVDLFIEMVFNYPTLAESYKYAAYECLAALG